MKRVKNDIKTREDVVFMVDSFYEKVNNDSRLSPIFNGFAEVDWDEHLPKMYSFWNTLIFSTPDYKGNPFAAHVPLPVSKIHFDTWISIFTQNIDEHFAGAIAESTKQRAASIATIFQSKLAFIQENNANIR